MLKTEYMGYQLDTIEYNGYRTPGKWSAFYIDGTKRHMVEGQGKNPEAACAAAQKTIQRRLKTNEAKATSD